MILQQELNMHKMCSKLVPKVLTSEQKKATCVMSETFLNDLKSDDSLFSQIISGDESWVFKYDPSTKHQPVQWKIREEPRHKKEKCRARSKRQ